jgi:hypothetical protein
VGHDGVLTTDIHSGQHPDRIFLQHSVERITYSAVLTFVAFRLRATTAMAALFFFFFVVLISLWARFVTAVFASILAVLCFSYRIAWWPLVDCRQLPAAQVFVSPYPPKTRHMNDSRALWRELKTVPFSSDSPLLGGFNGPGIKRSLG